MNSYKWEYAFIAIGAICAGLSMGIAMWQDQNWLWQFSTLCWTFTTYIKTKQLQKYENEAKHSKQ